MSGRLAKSFDIYIYSPGSSRDRRAARTPQDKLQAAWSVYTGETHKRKATRRARGKALSEARERNEAGWVGEAYIGNTNKMVAQFVIVSTGTTRRGTLKLVAKQGAAFAVAKKATKRKAAKKVAKRKAAKKVAKRSTIARAGQLKAASTRKAAKRKPAAKVTRGRTSYASLFGGSRKP